MLCTKCGYRYSQQYFSYTSCRFYWWRKPPYSENPTELLPATDKLYHINYKTNENNANIFYSKLKKVVKIACIMENQYLDSTNLASEKNKKSRQGGNRTHNVISDRF